MTKAKSAHKPDQLVCHLCNGAQWLEQINDGVIEPRKCACLKRRMLISFLGAELASVKHRRSDLYAPELDPETNEVVGDRTLDNLFIKGVWTEVAQHLRWALACKRLEIESFSYRMVDDERLLRVYLGDFAYNKRSSKVRDEIDTYNNLSDLISGHALLVVRLGKLAHSNRAAANVLQEALNIRASESKPTWLIEGERYFGDGHKFYNDEVGHYIGKNFDIVDVGGDMKAAHESRKALEELARDTMSMGIDGGDQIAPGGEETQERFKAKPGSLQNRSRFRSRRKWNEGGGLPDPL